MLISKARLVRPVSWRLLTLAAPVLAACAPLRPYTVAVPPPPETLSPPSAELKEYFSSEGLSLQVQRVNLRCDQVRQAIAIEIDQRQRRVTTTQRILLTIGSLAALATTVYSGLKDEPSKNVVVPLTALSGTALITALPSLGKDERIAALTDKLGAMKTAQAASVGTLNGLERDLLSIGLVKRKLAAVDSSSQEAKAINAQLEQQYAKTAESEEALRVSMTGLVEQCN